MNFCYWNIHKCAPKRSLIWSWKKRWAAAIKYASIFALRWPLLNTSNRTERIKAYAEGTLRWIDAPWPCLYFNSRTSSKPIGKITSKSTTNKWILYEFVLYGRIASWCTISINTYFFAVTQRENEYMKYTLGNISGHTETRHGHWYCTLFCIYGTPWNERLISGLVQCDWFASPVRRNIQMKSGQS